MRKRIKICPRCKIMNKFKNYSYCQKCKIEMDKEYRDNPEKEKRQRETDKKYQAKIRKLYPDKKYREYLIWINKNPEKHKAQMLANYAQRKGFIKKCSCERCGDENAVKHHDDYKKPLEIKWLCPSCHQKLHLNLIS